MEGGFDVWHRPTFTLLDNAHSAPAAQQYMGVEHIVGTQERQVGLGFIRSPSMQNAKRPQTGASLGPIICRV
jgi:hypothetical protein